MSEHTDIERVLVVWFDEGPTTMPDRVATVVADRIGRQRQRGRWRDAWMSFAMNPTLKVGLAAVAVLLVAVVGWNLFSNGSAPVGGTASSPTSSPAPVTTAAPTATPTVVSTPSPTASPSPTLAPTIGPGSHRSEMFPVPFTFSASPGWVNEADNLTAFVWSVAQDPAQNVEMLYDAYPPMASTAGCQRSIDWTRPHKASDLLAFWASDPSIDLVKEEKIVVGGLSGWRVQIAARPVASPACPGPEGSTLFYMIRWSDGIPSMSGGGQDPETIVLLATPTGQAIVIVDRTRDPARRDEAARILASLEFETPP